jgi:hypothetical protein
VGIGGVRWVSTWPGIGVAMIIIVIMGVASKGKEGLK